MDIIETTELPPQGQKQGGMDRQIPLGKWPWSVLSPGAKLALVATLSVLVILLLLFFILGGGTRTLRIPLNQVTSATVERGVFHDLIPLRANVVPRDTVYVDAMDGGRVDRVLVQAGDVVEAGQPMIVLSNTNLALQVIQQESQLNQAISQLQQNEISLEQNQLANQRSLADIDYNLIRLQRAAKRRNDLATRGMLSAEERDTVTDELAYYQKLRPIQSESGQRQSALYERLLPEIDRQLQNLRGNLTVVHDKLDSLVVRAPVSGKVTALDLKVGENLGAGQRLAEVTPDTGMKLEADIDEFYLPRVHVGQAADIMLDGNPVQFTVKRVSPQVHNGQFKIQLDLNGPSPASLVQGAAEQGHLKLGGDTPALILSTGAFLEQSGGNWCFVVDATGHSAQRRKIQVGRRTSEQLEILQGLHAGDKVVVSDYTGFDHIDRLVFTR